jgi:hypothetical protein
MPALLLVGPRSAEHVPPYPQVCQLSEELASVQGKVLRTQQPPTIADAAYDADAEGREYAGSGDGRPVHKLPTEGAPKQAHG